MKSLTNIFVGVAAGVVVGLLDSTTETLFELLPYLLSGVVFAVTSRDVKEYLSRAILAYPLAIALDHQLTYGF